MSLIRCRDRHDQTFSSFCANISQSVCVSRKGILRNICYFNIQLPRAALEVQSSVGRSVGWSVGGLCEKVTLRVSTFFSLVMVRPLLSSQLTPKEWNVYLHWFFPVIHSPNPQLTSFIRIIQASNVKKPTRFIVTSWIVGSDKGHNSAIRSVCLLCHRTSMSATLCNDMFGNITTSSPKPAHQFLDATL